MNNQQRIEITMASRVEFVNLLHAASNEVCHILDLDDDTAMNLSLALHEAAVNAIKHGNGEDVRKTLTVTFMLNPAELVIKIKDQGGGFDWGHVEDPCAPDNIGKANGRGIFLMRNFVDRVDFKHVMGEGLTVSLIKRLAGR